MATANPVTLEEARAAKKKLAALLNSLPIVGLGITRIGNGYGLKVNLRGNVASDAVPEQVDGVPIRTEVVGEIRNR